MRQSAIRSILLLLILGWTGPARPVPGFVSGQLLNTWCGKNDGLDREACYSYLRGASDAFHAIVDLAAARKEATPPWPNQCMPARISITKLRDAYLEFAARNPERMDNQAASLLIEVMDLTFPCAQKSESGQN
ncbi:MAG: Rap1a/Tai family immunity protein [Gammaproteobacteria bacterium]|nr:Rap1a/Tai family immunity protein [Gammaproteobacteria bacterium]